MNYYLSVSEDALGNVEWNKKRKIDPESEKLSQKEKGYSVRDNMDLKILLAEFRN